MAEIIYLALGSNLGNREALIKEATGRLCDYGERLCASSSLYETAPEGFASEHPFLNAVISIETDREPEDWLNYTQEIEKEMGRTTKSSGGTYHDRLIDIDILLYGSRTGEYGGGRLLLPHPRMHLRQFVLQPLAEIAPALVHPIEYKTIGELLEALDSTNKIK